MNELRFAAAMEGAVRQEMEALVSQVSPELLQAISLINKFQVEFELLLDRVQCVDINTGKYPAVDAAVLLGNDEVWQKALQQLGERTVKSSIDLTVLWMIHSLVEKSGQYYHQAALNSAHPATRLLLSSLAETKNMLKRRVDSLLRVLYNGIWSEIGFAPFVLGRD
jgi:hypothetical protein